VIYSNQSSFFVGHFLCPHRTAPAEDHESTWVRKANTNHLSLQVKEVLMFGANSALL